MHMNAQVPLFSFCLLVFGSHCLGLVCLVQTVCIFVEKGLRNDADTPSF